MIRQLVERALDRAGLYARRKGDLPRGIDWLLDVERLLAPDHPRVIVDVGANVGQTTIEVKRRFPDARVHAFEPVRSTFEALKRSVSGLPGVECHPLALSDHAGTQTIAVLPGSVFNSLSSPLLTAKQEAVQEEVHLSTLDALVAERRIDRIDLLKIDTEGHDLAVLTGAEATLARGLVRSVYVEVTFSSVNSQNSQFSPIFERLSGKGFRFMGLYEMDFFQINPLELSFCNALFFRPGK